MDKRFLPLGLAGCGPLWPPILVCEVQTTWEVKYWDQKQLRNQWAALPAVFGALLHRHSKPEHQPAPEKILFFPSHTSEQIPVPISVSIIKLCISPQHLSLVMLALGSPYRPAWQTFLPLLQGAETKIVPCWHSSRAWVATFQSHVVLPTRKPGTHTHTLQAARALPQCLL